MSSNTKIQWCDTTCNPVMGCDGCPLYPTTAEILGNIAVVLHAAGLNRSSTDLILESLPAAMPPSSYFHGRHEIARRIADLSGKPGDRRLEAKIEERIFELFRCYAGFLHLRHGADPGKPDKRCNKGYARIFEEVTPFPGRMATVARMRDLAGTARPEKPWLDDLPRLIFVSDMGDALSAGIEFQYLYEEIILVATSERGRRHIYLWLTKRPARMRRFAAWLAERGVEWPRNLVPMTSVINHPMARGVPLLGRIPAAARGLSVEPLWEGVTLNLDGIDWVIVGGESGRYAKPFDLAWARDLRDRCREAGVAFFTKQLGAKPFEDGNPLKLQDPHGGDWSEWPEDLRLREMPEVFRSLVTPASGTTFSPHGNPPRTAVLQCGRCG